MDELRLHELTYAEIAHYIAALEKRLYLWKHAAHLSSLVFLKEGTAYDAWRAIQEAREHDATDG